MPIRLISKVAASTPVAHDPEPRQQRHLAADAATGHRVALRIEGAGMTHTVTLIVPGKADGQGRGHWLTSLVAWPLAAPRDAEPEQHGTH